jgi:diadenosine tetraphosphate (Ap4A) HIT family hydrolase
MNTTSVLDCLFCHLPSERIIGESNGFWVIRDAYPVTPGHTLVIPKRHTETWFDLTDAERAEANRILCEQRQTLCREDQSISGFNIGMNCGVSAGQTIFHCHIHLIPRRDGDSQNPRGGVRGVIAEKQTY